MKNPAYGNWSEEETNWSEKDTEFLKNTLTGTTVPTSYEEIKAKHEALKY